jgi:hypothetical protein
VALSSYALGATPGTFKLGPIAITKTELSEGRRANSHSSQMRQAWEEYLRHPQVDTRELSLKELLSAAQIESAFLPTKRKISGRAPIRPLKALLLDLTYNLYRL